MTAVDVLRRVDELADGTRGSVDARHVGAAIGPHVADPPRARGWTAAESDPDGTLFTGFLAQMHCESSADGSCPFDGKYRDWRIPTIAELRSIIDPGAPGCGSGSPCIDPIFGPTTPTTASYYWSSSSWSTEPANTWVVYFFDGNTYPSYKGNTNYARAVRGGS